MFDKSLYDAVAKESRTIRTLETILELLTWDQETMMPKAATAHRAEQKALLSGIIHEKKSNPSYFENLDRLLHTTPPDSDEAIVIKRLHRDIMKAKKLPTQFVQKLTRATSEAFDAWQRAKHLNQWPAFKPHLEKLVDLMRQKAEFLGFHDHPLDPLLDEYEPEITTRDISTLFSSLKVKLQKVLDEVKQSTVFGRKRRPFPSTAEAQMAISREVVTFIGFDWNRGRIDTSEHPFSTGIHPTDSRITIRHNFDDLLDQVMSALHEAGHGMYEMGLERQHFGTPLAEAASLSIHESQSRLWETVIGRSKHFSSHLFSIISRYYNGRSPFASKQELYNELNRVECSLIRTQADEVTYPFHVIVRFDIERELIEGKLSVKDVPARWNSAMRDTLGVAPTTDTEGCLQDVHWSLGSFGYFPTYALGTLYAVCFYEAMKQSIPSLDQLLEQGLFAPLHAWLFEHVWKHGRRFSSAELVTKALGRQPSEDDYINYLRSKYVG